MVVIVRSLPALTFLPELFERARILMWSSVLTNTYDGMRVQNLEYRIFTSVLIDTDPSHKISLELGEMARGQSTRQLARGLLQESPNEFKSKIFLSEHYGIKETTSIR
jgi:hypothetical protein